MYVFMLLPYAVISVILACRVSPVICCGEHCNLSFKPLVVALVSLKLNVIKSVWLKNRRHIEI